MGPEADRIIKTSDLNDDDKNKYNAIVNKFDAYFIPKRNIVHVKATFYGRGHNEGTTIYGIYRKC